MLDHYLKYFTAIAQRMGRNYIANMAIESVHEIMHEEGFSIFEKVKLVDEIHKAYSQIFTDDNLPWSTAEIYKPEPVVDVVTPFEIENDPF